MAGWVGSAVHRSENEKAHKQTNKQIQVCMRWLVNVQPFVKRCSEAVKELVFEADGERGGENSLCGQRQPCSHRCVGVCARLIT